MKTIHEYSQRFTEILPETLSILDDARLTVHDSVRHVVLHGSRGFGGNPRPDSDIDLSLIADSGNRTGDELEHLLKEIAETTLRAWKGSIEADIAVIFDTKNCGLKCFFNESRNDTACNSEGIDCFGIYKNQKGFSGIVENAGIEVQKMYPCMVIWSKD